VVGVDLVFQAFFPKSEHKNFEAGFSGFNFFGFLCASPEQKIITPTWALQKPDLR
jgi:hypothetical protein